MIEMLYQVMLAFVAMVLIVVATPVLFMLLIASTVGAVRGAEWLFNVYDNWKGEEPCA